MPFSPGLPGRHRPLVGTDHPPPHGRRRGGCRLQPHQRRPHGHADRARFHRPDAVENRGIANGRPVADLGEHLLQCPAHQQRPHPADGRRELHRGRPVPRSRSTPPRRQNRYYGHLRLRPGHHQEHIDLGMGQYAAQGRAGARQHRLDGRSRQDGRAEDRGAEPAHPAQESRQRSRGRLRVDRSVQQGRQSERRQLRAVLAALGSVGSRRTEVAPAASGAVTEQLRIQRRHLDGRRPQHLERLRHRPRPEFRHHQRPTARRRHALPGGAVFVLPRIDHGAEQRLDHARRPRSPPCSRRATPTRRSACSSAGSR